MKSEIAEKKGFSDVDDEIEEAIDKMNKSIAEMMPRATDVAKLIDGLSKLIIGSNEDYANYPLLSEKLGGMDELIEFVAVCLTKDLSEIEIRTILVGAEIFDAQADGEVMSNYDPNGVQANYTHTGLFWLREDYVRAILPDMKASMMVGNNGYGEFVVAFKYPKVPWKDILGKAGIEIGETKIFVQSDAPRFSAYLVKVLRKQGVVMGIIGKGLAYTMPDGKVIIEDEYEGDLYDTRDNIGDMRLNLNGGYVSYILPPAEAMEVFEDIVRTPDVYMKDFSVGFNGLGGPSVMPQTFHAPSVQIGAMLDANNYHQVEDFTDYIEDLNKKVKTGLVSRSKQQRGTIASAVTFGFFMGEAIIHYNMGQKSLNEEHKWSLPPAHELLKMAFIVGAFSVASGIVIGALD